MTVLDEAGRPVSPKQVRDPKVQMEVLRNLIALGVKIDRLWVTFITIYTSFYGIAIFYSGVIEVEYFFIAMFIIGFFSWMNGSALFHNYVEFYRLGAYFQRINTEIPSMNRGLVFGVGRGKRGIVYITHGLAALILMYFLLDRSDVFQALLNESP
jgi:hypothetical protein